MQYYLETNVLYGLKQAPSHIIDECYSSYFSILEIVSGTTTENYLKRRSALRGVIDSRLTIDWRTPDIINFSSFNIYNEFTMQESTVDTLQDAMLNCVNSDSYEQFARNQINGISVVDYFADIDNGLTDKFRKAFLQLMPSIKKSSLVKTLELGDSTVEVDFTKALKDGYINDGNHSMLVKIIATSCQNIIARSPANEKPEFQLTDVINSYNGGVDFFICGWLSYNRNKIGLANNPGRNDFQDLIHFIYLRNHLDRKIVSNDKIYSKLAPEFTITWDSLIG